MCLSSNTERTGVAPHAGAWIEMTALLPEALQEFVAPHAGAWIEIFTQEEVHLSGVVAPHAGAWIEIMPLVVPPKTTRGRAPRGRVD